MINFIFAIALIFFILWVAKKFYLPMEIAQRPDLYPTAAKLKLSKKEMGIILGHSQRWKNEGKLSREEYDRITDICLEEMKQFEEPKS